MKREAPDDLTRDEQRRLWEWFERAKEDGRLPRRLDKRWLRDQVDSCLDWHRMEEKKRADYVAACRNWIRKDRLWGRPDEKPQEMGRRGRTTLNQRDLWGQGEVKWPQ